MASCSKDIAPVPSPDPDAWMYDETLPVPIRFGVGELPATKGAIETAADMVGKEFGFFATSHRYPNWTIQFPNPYGLDMPQNALATCVANPTDPSKVTFEFSQNGGPYYYPQLSNDNYTFYAYHSHLADSVQVLRNKETQKYAIVVKVGVGKTDVLWSKAAATPVTVTENGVENTYDGFNARFLRKGGLQPSMTFDHLTACVSFNAQTKKSAFSSSNEGKDQIKITGITVLNTPILAQLIVASQDDNYKKEGTLIPSKRENLSESASFMLTDTPAQIGTDFFLAESNSIKVRLDYDVISGEAGGATASYSSEYTLEPVVKNGDKAGETGFFAGYRYNYNFVVYTPERIAIEATVEPYVSAFNEPESVNPDNE